jgi:hypothetical protein
LPQQQTKETKVFGIEYLRHCALRQRLGTQNFHHQNKSHLFFRNLEILRSVCQQIFKIKVLQGAPKLEIRRQNI